MGSWRHRMVSSLYMSGFCCSEIHLRHFHISILPTLVLPYGVSGRWVATFLYFKWHWKQKSRSLSLFVKNIYKPKQKQKRKKEQERHSPMSFQYAKSFRRYISKNIDMIGLLFWQLIGWTMCSKDKKSLTIHFRFWYKNSIFVPKLVFVVRNTICSLEQYSKNFARFDSETLVKEKHILFLKGVWTIYKIFIFYFVFC